MTSERWERLKDIFTRALEQPSDLRDRFVREACAADAELLSELRRLLDEHDRLDNMLSQPALGSVEPVCEKAPPQFRPETVLAGRFRIVRFIARGGMGEVYEAEDLALKERVALKTIRPEIAQDEEVLAMFKTEIQLARKVTHPNVCRIHDLAQHVERGADGAERTTHFLTMELLAGETLSQYLSSRRPLSAPLALALVGQCAAALEAAHAAGVIHRDFKPGNVIIVPADADRALRAVVTDFGLALPAHEAEARSTPAARGTPEYMAPEQVEGTPVTPATDVYSLALVIAEMVGSRGKRVTSSRIRTKTTGKLTKWGLGGITLTLVGLTPPNYRAPAISIPSHYTGWSKVLDKCLAYDPEQRYSSPAEVVEALRAALQGRSTRRRNFALSLGLLAAIVLIAVAGPVLRLGKVSAFPTARRLFVENRNLTAWAGSPDGRLIVATEFGTRGTGNLVLRDVKTGTTRPLMQERGASGTSAIFSPDGRWIAYLRETEREGELRLISIRGAAMRTLYKDSAYYVRPVDWSPDGRRVLANFQQADGSVKIGIIAVRDGSVTFLNSQGGMERPRFSANGQWILFNARQPGDEIAMDIIRMSLDGSRMEALVQHSADDVLIGLSADRSRVIFRTDRQGTLDLWSAPTKPAAPARVERLWPNIGAIQPLNITRNGSFFYRIEPQVQEVYVAGLDVEAGRIVAPPRRVLQRFRGASRWSGWSPDSRELLFVYLRDQPTLGFYAPATQTTREVRVRLAGFQRPQWHPSGGWIDVVGSDGKGGSGHFKVNPATGEASLLISERELESGFEGVWSPDGITMFNRFNQWKRGIFRLRMGTRARRVIYVPPPGNSIGLENLALSPDGHWLAFQARQVSAGTASLMVMRAEGGPANALLTISLPQEFVMGSFAWTPDSRTVLAARTNKQASPVFSELWKVPIDGSPAVRLDFPRMRIAQMRLSPDGRTLAFTSGEGTAEVWVLENLFSRP